MSFVGQFEPREEGKPLVRPLRCWCFLQEAGIRVGQGIRVQSGLGWAITKWQSMPGDFASWLHALGIDVAISIILSAYGLKNTAGLILRKRESCICQVRSCSLMRLKTGSASAGTATRRTTSRP